MKDILAFIFYFITILPIMWEGISLIHPIKTKRITRRIKNNKYDNLTDTEQTVTWLMTGYFIWIFAGLFSFQWPIFLFLLIMGLIPKKYILLSWLDSLITLILLIFIVINKYHFKIDVWNYLFN